MVRDRGEPIGYRNGLPIYQRLGSRQPQPRTPSKSKALRQSESLLKASTFIVKERARGACERCLIRPDVQTHHRCPRRAGGSAHRPWINMPANLIRLCQGCHDDVESNRQRAYTLGLLIHAGENPALIPVTVGLAPFTHRFLFDDDGGKTVVEEAA